MFTVWTPNKSRNKADNEWSPHWIGRTTDLFIRKGKSMSTHVGDIFVNAKLNDKDYKKGLKSLDKWTGGIASKMGRALTVAGLGLFIKKATQAGASLNAMGTIIDASLPNMTKQVDDFAKSAGAMFGLSETQAKGFVGKYASMASAMGYTEKQAYNMSTALTGLAGDVASYYHISADDAYAKLGAVFTGETEALKQLGVVMTQNALDQFALQQGFGKTTAQMTELEKTTLRYQFVMDRLKLAGGDFAKYANTWSGSIATIKLNWANFMATIGQGIINILLPLLQLIARVSNALTALGSRFLAWSKALMGIKANTGQTVQKNLKSVGSGISDVGSGLGGVGNNAKGAKKQVQALKRELLGFDKITKLSKEQGTSAGGVGGGAGGIGGGGIDFSDAETDLMSFTDKAKDYLENIKLPPALSLALRDLKESFSGLFEVLKSAGKWVWDNVLVPLGKWTINELLPRTIELLASAFRLLTEVLKFLGTVLKPLWKNVLKPFFQFIGGVVVDAVEKAKLGIDFFARALNGLNESVEKIKGKLEPIRDVWNSFKSKSVTAKLSLNDKFSTAWNAVKNAWNGLKSKTATITLGFKETLKTKWNELARKVNDARAKAPQVIKNILPSMPYLAQGGYVKANTPQLAVIGDNKREGEIVAPESKLRAMAQEVANQNNNAEVVRLLSALLVAVQTKDNNVYLDGEQIKNNVVRRINNHTRATGQLELIV